MSTLSEKISDLMTEIRTDKSVFENFEIDSRFIEKYQKVEGNSKIFDYWYNRFSEVKDQASAIEKVAALIKGEMQDVFTNCYSCFTDLSEKLKDFPNYSLKQARANIDFLNRNIEIMVICKTCDGKLPEECSDFLDFQKMIYRVQEGFNDSKVPTNFTIKTLFWDDSLSIECITRDFPICIR